MITMNSTLREVYAHPVGHDIIDFLLMNGRINPKLFQNPVVLGMKLGAIDRLVGKKAPGLAKTIVNLLAMHNEMPPPPTAAIEKKWWKEAVVYQIYPRSFQDSNGDGIGDLTGIKQRIPYLKELGVDVLWLSPIYDSPNDDNGYDIRNYRKIMKEFGTMASFNALLAEVHKNGMKLIMDLVVNHTSDEHEWFQKALKDPAGPEKDYYIWAAGKNGGAPNNWTSFFSGPAWNYYEETGEWALHLFSKKQMDLNWDNPDLRGEVYDMIRWWLDKGVDGFRMDVINLISKDGLADGNDTVGAAVNIRGIEHYFYGPRLHEYLQEMRRESFGRYDVMTVGECAGTGVNMSKLLTAPQREELDLVFNFDQLENPGKSRMLAYEYDLRHLKDYFLKWQQQYANSCWPTLFFENHDNPRMVSKVNPDPAYRVVIAKLLAVLQFTLRGTPFVYQGQEIGMTNSRFTQLSDLRDVEALNRYAELKEQYAAAGSAAGDMAFEVVAWGTRDHARTPMQWDDTANAGFTGGEPWMGVNPNYPAINVQAEQGNPDSVYHFYRRIIALRKQNEALVYGEFAPVFVRDKNVFCYFRHWKGKKFYIEINLSSEDQKRPGPLTAGHRLLLGNYGGVAPLLRPYEANVYALN